MILEERLIDYLTTDELSQVALDSRYLEQFIKKYNVTLLLIDQNTENPEKTELMYFFDDNLGGYTIKAIQNSLDGKVYYL
jgi:hypothetical protein